MPRGPRHLGSVEMCTKRCRRASNDPYLGCPDTNKLSLTIGWISPEIQDMTCWRPENLNMERKRPSYISLCTSQCAKPAPKRGISTDPRWRGPRDRSILYTGCEDRLKLEETITTDGDTALRSVEERRWPDMSHINIFAKGYDFGQWFIEQIHQLEKKYNVGITQLTHPGFLIVRPLPIIDHTTCINDVMDRLRAELCSLECQYDIMEPTLTGGCLCCGCTKGTCVRVVGATCCTCSIYDRWSRKRSEETKAWNSFPQDRYCIWWWWFL